MSEMPVTSSKDLIRFVNELEVQLNEVKRIAISWENNEQEVLGLVPQVSAINATAKQAMLRADNALAEISAAVVASTKPVGQRLADTLEKLKRDIFLAIENGEVIGIGGGGGEVNAGLIYDEINAAIADVDPTIEDGLKLSYKLSALEGMAASTNKLSGKRVIMPHKYEAGLLQSVDMKAEGSIHETFIKGDVTVLNDSLSPVLDENNNLITGTIDKDGMIHLSAIPKEPVRLYYPTVINLENIDEDFFYKGLETTLQKNYEMVANIITMGTNIQTITEDIKAMKGANWTIDFSIMSNHVDIIKEMTAPRSLAVQFSEEGNAMLSMAYLDHEYVSHYVAEKFNEETQSWEPVNENGGIINK